MSLRPAWVDGRRRKVTAKTKTDASAKARALVARREVGQPVDNQSMTVADAFLERDVPNRKGGNLAPKTIEQYERTGATIRDELGTIKLAALTVENVEAMLDRLATEPRRLGRSSLTKVRGTIQRALAMAERRGQVSRNVANAAELSGTAAATRRRGSLRPEDARRLLVELKNERNGLMFAVSLRLGLRPGEAAALYWDAIDDGGVNVTRGIRRVGNRVVYAPNANGVGHIVMIHHVDPDGTAHTIEASASNGVHIGTVSWDRVTSIKRPASLGPT